MISSGKVEESILDQVTIFSPSAVCFVGVGAWMAKNQYSTCSGIDDGNVGPVCDLVEGHIPDRLVRLFVLLYKIRKHSGTT